MKRTIALTVVAALAACGTALAASTAGMYRGKTKQGQPIAVKLGSRGMVTADYKASYVCKDPKTGKVRNTLREVATGLGKSPFRGGRGRIDGYFATQDGSDKIRFVAVASRRTLSGYFTETFTSNRGNTCRSGKVKFSIKHV